MGKYIRTKDGKLFEIEKDLGKYGKSKAVIICDFNGNFIDVEKQNMILKQDDTIEKLCDEFVGVWINYYESEKKDAHEEYHYDEEKGVFYDEFGELTPKETIEKFDMFYGAIWTDKGLIYVAKMNEKGELELL